jgi:hypothetical protein
MSLRTVFNTVKRLMPEVPDPQVFEYISEAYLELLSEDVAELIFLNRYDSNFPYPILQDPNALPPVGGDTWWSGWNNDLLTDLSYDLSSPYIRDSINDEVQLQIDLTKNGSDSVPVLVRKLANVFTIRDSRTINDFPEIYRPAYCSENPIYSKYQFVKVPYQSRSFSDDRGAADIQFFFPPNNYETPFFLEFYWRPAVPISSVNSKVLMDTKKWKDALIDGAVGRYEDIVNGQSERKMKFETQRKKEFKKEFNNIVDNRESNKFKTRYV